MIFFKVDRVLGHLDQNKGEEREGWIRAYTKQRGIGSLVGEDGRRERKTRAEAATCRTREKKKTKDEKALTSDWSQLEVPKRKWGHGK